MRRGDLAGFVLQNVGIGSLQNARCAAAFTHDFIQHSYPRGMLAEFASAPACFHADQPHATIAEESVKNSDRIRSAAHARDDRVRQPSSRFQYLRAGLATDYRLKTTHHRRIWMRAQHAP